MMTMHTPIHGIPRMRFRFNMDFSLLCHVSHYEVWNLLQREDNYGYGLYVRKKKKGLKVIEKTYERSKERFEFLLDLWIYKQMNEDRHWPLWTIAPQFEQDKAYQEWYCYLDYLHGQGARRQ